MNLQKAIDIIKYSEGFRDKAYQDGGGIWTLGYGTVIRPDGSHVKEGDECEEPTAYAWLVTNVETVAHRMETCLIVDTHNHIVLTEGQYNALVSFIYNIGIGNFKASTMFKLIEKSDFANAANEFEKWDKINGVESKGLKARREREKALFLS